MFFSKARLYRYALFVLSLIFWPTAALYCIGTDSIIDLIHFLSVPLLVSWLLIFRPQIFRKNIVPYLILTAAVSLLTIGYLIAFSQFIPYIQINWFELPIVVYFLLSVYVILWLLDKFINLIGSFTLRINSTTAKNVIISGFRIAFLIFAVTPYLVAVFTTHWIKFAGADSPKKLPGLEYRQVSFTSGDGVKLDGLFIPSTTGMSDSAVVIAPGRSPTKNLFLPSARVLSSNGYNVLLFAPRGNGDSSGHKYSFGINEANDILSAIDYLETKHAESSRYIFGLGINEGAAALVAAASIDDRLTAVAIDNASGYEVSLPDSIAGYLPKWMEKTLLRVTKSVISMDIGRTGWGAEKLYQDISQISPCPALFTNGLKNNQSDRMRTIELYTKAKEPKMLWLTPPPIDEELNIGLEKEYFQNILVIFDLGRAKQRPGYWRTSL